MEKVTVGIIGCGRISKLHLAGLSQLPDCRIAYACDLIRKKAEDAKAEHPQIETVCTDYRQILRDPAVDGVLVLTPNRSHDKITLDALRAGKHVLCEKPIAVNAIRAKKMAEEAEKQGKILNIGVCNRFNRSVELLEEMNRQKKFGTIYHVVCSFRSCRSIPGLGGAFTTKRESGGGVLIDWGVHFLDLILYVLGGAKPLSVTCDTYSEMAKDMKAYRYHRMWAEDTADPENGTNDVEDFVSGYIRTDRAGISLNGAWAQNLEKDEMYVDFLGDRGGARLQYGGKITFFDGETLQTEAPEYEIPQMHAVEDADFIRAIRTGEPSRNRIENVLASARLLDGLYRSAKFKKEIRLS